MDILCDLSFTDVISNLKKISEINVNEKLIIYGNKLEIDNRYLQFITRWYCANNRLQTLEFIKKLCQKSFYYSNNLIKFNSYKKDNDSLILSDKLKLLTDLLDNSINGLNNLKNTYINDIMFVKETEELILNINKTVRINRKLE
jgi:hypothetical protein